MSGRKSIPSKHAQADSSDPAQSLLNSFHGLSLSGKSPISTPRRGSRELDTTQAGPFAGGFHPGLLPPPPILYQAAPRLPQPPYVATNDGTTSARPAHMPMPIPEHDRGQSLTMYHALNPSLELKVPPPPSTPPRLYSDPVAQLSVTALTQTPQSTSAKTQQSAYTKTPQSASTKTPRSSRRKRESSAGVEGEDYVPCNGITLRGQKCTRKVKRGLYQDVAFCHQHSDTLLERVKFTSPKTGESVRFQDWIPDYLHRSTQLSLRAEMIKPRSESDEDGYIYAYEIEKLGLDSNQIHIKVGRTIVLNNRIDQWNKQCNSTEPNLLGWWPDGTHSDTVIRLMAGRVEAGRKGALCHRLERLVHIELFDLAARNLHLNPAFPGNVDPGKIDDSDFFNRSRKTCIDCGRVHKEIFSFARAQDGPYKRKEWDLIVKPVIEKWGSFVEQFV